MLGRGAGRARLLGVLGGLLLVGPAEAGTFRFEEAGSVHYTNTPSDPRYRQLLGWPESRPGSRAAVTYHRSLAPYAELIRAAAQRHGVDQRLVEAVITVESAGNPRAVSRKGAQGLMQLMPQRSALLGVRKPFDPRQNVDGGVRHLRDLLDRFSGDLTLALAAYNAGEEAVRTYHGVPPYPETQDYVRKIRALYDGLEGPGAPWSLGQAPQRIYRRVSRDGTVTYTNLPPTPTQRLQPRF